MLITLIYLSLDKILYLLKKIKLYKYLPRRITANRFFEDCISYIKTKLYFLLYIKGYDLRISSTNNNGYYNKRRRYGG